MISVTAESAYKWFGSISTSMTSGGELGANIFGVCSWNLIMTDFQIWWDNDDNEMEEKHLRILDLSSWQFHFLEVKRGTGTRHLVLLNKGRLTAEVEGTVMIYAIARGKNPNV